MWTKNRKKYKIDSGSSFAAAICLCVMDTFMLRATIFGEQIITWLVLAFIYWCVDKHAGQMMALNVSVACTWNQFIKWKCRIDRPWIRDDRIIPVQQALAGAGGYSFPSGHTQRAAAVWGALGHSLWEKKERAVSIVCWVILAVIAFSRNYLGVHTPQDVLAALALGIVIIFVSGRALRWVDEGDNRDIIVAGVLCLLCFLPMLKARCLSNAGAGMGLLIGWVIERRFIGFETKDGWPERCVRFAVGGAGGIVYFVGAFDGTEYGDGIEICRIFHFIFAGSFYYGRVSVLFCEKRAFQKGDYPAGDFAGWNFRTFRVQG